MRRTATTLTLMLGAGALAACSVRDEPQPEATTTTSETVSTVASPTTPEPSGTPMVAPPATVLQTQPGPEGSQAALNKVAVVGNIMTVSMTVMGGSGTASYIKLDEVSAIDDATSQRISVLKDNAGNWMAAPLGGGGKELRVDTDGPQVVWLKFPAPPATTKTVSITLPGVAPFDAVPVAR